MAGSATKHDNASSIIYGTRNIGNYTSLSTAEIPLLQTYCMRKFDNFTWGYPVEQRGCDISVSFYSRGKNH